MPLTEQELHNLAMNIVGEALQELGWEFLLVNSDRKKNPQFVCIDPKGRRVISSYALFCRGMTPMCMTLPLWRKYARKPRSTKPIPIGQG